MPRSALARTADHARLVGLVQRGELGLSAFGKTTAAEFGLPELDISVVWVRGPFDTGPWIPLDK